ncbi:hypothetical protein ABAC460_12835 [Asticcacaulis sp. AC460]|uniref:IclR family transcriptional regulator n=1 Tax=Asticcacaulis sp. AC460 TaxID=1282360 RepID=UPI0003C3E863|nr:IclR family transcriptional regulator [Asticcacaulis sp. AC460]ESQ89390.1 hypothetical protein ABAC460_12835 [Asticcacaulis sp. AC460]
MANPPKSPEAETSRLASYTAPALEKGFNVIELLAQSPHGLTVSEIANGLGLSMSEIFRVIMVMERRAWLRKAPGDRYSVTPKVLELAFRATPAEELAFVAAPLMRDLANQTDQACHLVVRNDDRGLVVLRQENPGPTGFAVRIGASISLETSCSGHVLLAFAPGELGDDDLGTKLRKVRGRGYEMMKSARTLGVTDISYPIFGFDGHVVAALTVPFLKLIDGSQTVDAEAARGFLAETATAISVGLGGVERTAR